MKKCTKCKIEKDVTEFGKDKTSKDGLAYNCKSCNKEYFKKYHENHKRIITEKRVEYNKKYRENNKERSKERFKEYYKKNNRILTEKRKEYYKNNKEYFKEYNENNKERRNKWNREKRKTDPLYKMSCNLRNRTYQAFKSNGYKKNTKTQEMLGVSWEVCKAHIERQFTIGMNWDNQGKWHIDHIIPLASANTEEELIKLCHYSNLQPLWAEDNLKKSDKIEGQQNKLRL